MINTDWHALVYQGMVTVSKSSLFTTRLVDTALKLSVSNKWRVTLFVPVNVGYLYLKLVARLVEAELYIRGVHWALIHCHK